MGFSRQEYWRGLPFSSPGDLPNPGIKPSFAALQADSLLSEPLGKLYGFRVDPKFSERCSHRKTERNPLASVVRALSFHCRGHVFHHNGNWLINPFILLTVPGESCSS